MPVSPTLKLERRLFAQGAQIIVALDEVGRGSWAGPLVVGAVAISTGKAGPKGLRDSKLLSPKRRAEFAESVPQWAAGVALGEVEADEIDRIGLSLALRTACQRALASLCAQGLRPGHIIVDGPHDIISGGHPETLVEAGLAEIGVEIIPVIKGDRVCVSVAGASVVAKHARDSDMVQRAEHYPYWGFASNVGYSSPAHWQGLMGHGLSAIHRRSWRYVEGLPWPGQRRPTE